MKTYEIGDVISLVGDYVVGQEVPVGDGLVAVVVEAFLGGATARVEAAA